MSVYRPLIASAADGAATLSFLVGASRKTLLSYSASTCNEGATCQLLPDALFFELFDVGAGVEFCCVGTARGAGVWERATFASDAKPTTPTSNRETHDKRARMVPSGRESVL